jgi:hypothetical protein
MALVLVLIMLNDIAAIPLRIERRLFQRPGLPPKAVSGRHKTGHLWAIPGASLLLVHGARLNFPRFVNRT